MKILCILAAALLVFQHNFLFFVATLSTFKTLLPTTLLLLRSGVSNITSEYVSAARLLSFHHKPALLCFFAAMLLTFSHYFLLIVATLLMLLSVNLSFLLRSCC
jgi:hypothetical protein